MGSPRRIRDIIDIAEFCTLDDLIEQLVSFRDKLDAASEPQICIRGDEIFGQKLTIRYYRLQTKEEVELEERYRKRCKSAKMG